MSLLHSHPDDDLTELAFSGVPLDAPAAKLGTTGVAAIRPAISAAARAPASTRRMSRNGRSSDIQPVRIADRRVGPGQPCLVIAEIGINHNGAVDIALDLITEAARAGADVVKFQKRTIDRVFTPEQLSAPRESPYGTTYGELKHGLEFDRRTYEVIDAHCRRVGIAWTASCWDEASVDFIEDFEPPFLKIASASLTDDELLRHHRATGRPIILSTGMSSIEEIDQAVEVLGTDDLVLLHCTSSYPSDPDEINLRAIATLQDRYGVPAGYSGHEEGIVTTIAAVSLGAAVVERHVTLDRSMWGTDQGASIEIDDLSAMVSGIRTVERALGDGHKRVFESELAVRARLRRQSALHLPTPA